MKYSKGCTNRKKDPDTRAMLSFRFRAMYQNLGLTRPEVAKLLHVSERTLHNWDIGHHEIPYSAYRLLRLLTRQELPGKAWAGWHITAGVLWSPEGHGFKPVDSNWWSLLCRRAALFHSLYEENTHLRSLVGAVRQSSTARRGALAPLRAVAADALPGEAGRAAEPARPNLLLEHFTESWVEKPGFHWGNQFAEIPVIRLAPTNIGGAHV